MRKLFLGTLLDLRFGLVDDRLNFLLQAGVELEGFLKIRVSFFLLALIEASDAAVDMGFRVTWLDAYHFAKVPHGVLVFFSAQIGEPAVVRCLCIFWLEPNGLAVILDGRFRFPELSIGQSPIVIGIGVFRLLLDGLAEIANSFFPLSERGVGNAAIVISRGKFGIQA